MGFPDELPSCASPRLPTGPSSAPASESAWWSGRSVTDLAFHTPVTAGPGVTIKEAVGLLNSLGIDQLPIVGDDNCILGVVTEGNLSARVLSGRATGSDPVSSVLYKSFRKVSVSTSLGALAKVFDSEHFAVVLQTQKVYTGGGTTTEKSVVVGVVTRIDLLRYISDGGAAAAAASPRK